MHNLQLTDHADLGYLYDLTCDTDEGKKAMAGGHVTKQMFVDYCIEKKYPSIGLECDGQPIGGVIFDGNAAHIEIASEFHGRWAILLPKVLEWVFSHKDPIDVGIYRTNEKALRFMEKNKWPVIKEDETFITYHMSSDTSRLYKRAIRAKKNSALQST